MWLPLNSLNLCLSRHWSDLIFVLLSTDIALPCGAKWVVISETQRSTKISMFGQCVKFQFEEDAPYFRSLQLSHVKSFITHPAAIALWQNFWKDGWWWTLCKKCILECSNHVNLNAKVHFFSDLTIIVSTNFGNASFNSLLLWYFHVQELFVLFSAPFGICKKMRMSTILHTLTIVSPCDT